MGLLRLAAALAAAAAATPAAAHIAADPAQATAGAYQAVRFRVGHGCDGAATTAVRIEIPAQMVSARPQPKPGWALEIAKAGDRVAAITWRGTLPADQFEEFAIFFKLPAQAGRLALPAVQTCGETQIRWTEIPDEGPRPKRPAPILTLTPAPVAGETHRH